MKKCLVILWCLLCSSAFGQSAAQYAAEMNQTGVFRHDPKWRGAEVIYQSSGTATESSARNWWMNSSRHRALLISGQITDIACVGRYCVGRGSGFSSPVYRRPRLFRR